MTDKIHEHIHLPETQDILEAKNLTIKYGRDKIIDNISFKIKSNEFISLLGINGSGKTTIIKAIMGLIPYKGEIIFEGKDIKKWSKKELAKKIAYVPQMFNNKGDVSVYDYISFGRFPYSGSFTISKIDKQIINNVLNNLNLNNIRDKLLNEISGGQRQKVALATALVQDTEIIILDEPTSFLDIKNQYEILEISHLLHMQGKTLIVVLHDLNQSIKYSDSVILLDKKRIFHHGSPHKALTKKNILDVYGVEVQVQKINGKNHVIDIKSESIMKELKWF